VQLFGWELQRWKVFVIIEGQHSKGNCCCFKTRTPVCVDKLFSEDTDLA
jgi:hypothetical protein